MPLAEDAGLIDRLGRQVLHQACAAAASWTGPPAGPARVAVNVSPLELHRPDYPTQVSDVLTATGLPADRLELEITDGQWLDRGDPVHDNLTALAATGVHLVIDDFGTGYSSFGYLQRLPLTGLKIDKSFVAGLPDIRACAAIVDGVLTLAAELHLDVTAEGVETAAQLAFLTTHGCPRAQGHLLGRPQTPA